MAKRYIEVRAELFNFLDSIMPQGMTWDEALVTLLTKDGYIYPPLDGARATKLRKICNHPKRIIKTGLYPSPEEVWWWCPDCNLLIDKIEQNIDTKSSP